MFGFSIRKIDRAFNDRKVLATYARAGEVGLKRAGRILANEVKKGIKFAAPTKLQYEKLRSPDPKKRARAAKSIAKQRARRSNPGGPPLARNRSRYRTIRNVEYAFVRSEKKVLVGPVWFRTDAKNVVPETLEYGGTATIREVNLGSEKQPAWVAASGKKYRNVPAKRRRKRSVKIAPRPFVRPAYERKREVVLSILEAAWGGV